MKIKATVHIDNTDIQKRIKLLKTFFKPGGQAHRILDEEALKTRDKIRIDVFSGQRLITGKGRSSVNKTKAYTDLFKHKVTYNTKRQEIFLGMHGVPVKQKFSQRHLYSITQANSLQGNPFNKLSTPTNVTASSESTLRVPSALASTYASEMLNKNQRLKQIPNNEEYFVARPDALKGTAIKKRYGAKGNVPIAFKRDKENKKLIPIGIFYDKAKYDKIDQYETPKIQAHTSKMINVIGKTIMSTVKNILRS